MDDYIAEAGTSSNPPPVPAGGFPRRYLPFPIRWAVRLLFLPFLHLDIAMQRVAVWLIRPPYKKAGKCKKRGNCCYYILMKKTKGPLYYLALFWNTQINGFYLRGSSVFDEEGKEKMVMGCRYLNPDGSCRIYHFRPMVCRKWPVIEYFGYPKILKGCGYSAVPRKKNKQTGDSSPLKILS